MQCEQHGLLRLSYVGSSYIPKEEIFHNHIERDTKIKTSFYHALLAGFESFEAVLTQFGDVQCDGSIKKRR